MDNDYHDLHRVLVDCGKYLFIFIYFLNKKCICTGTSIYLQLLWITIHNSSWIFIIKTVFYFESVFVCIFTNLCIYIICNNRLAMNHREKKKTISPRRKIIVSEKYWQFLVESKSIYVLYLWFIVVIQLLLLLYK